MPTQCINEFRWDLGESFCIDQRQLGKKKKTHNLKIHRRAKCVQQNRVKWK